MKSTKQLIGVGLVSIVAACASGQSALAPTAVREDAPSAGGGRGVSVGGVAPRTEIPMTSARVYAQSAVNDFGASYGYVSSSRSSGSSVPPVVIQFGSKNPDAIASMEEDLAVMTHIIDGALDRMGDDVPDEKMGIKLYYASGGKSVRALYLENFGPLFMVKVNFPVHAPASTEAKAPEQPDDSEWNRARQSIFGQNDTRWTGAGSGVPYEAERVEALKKQLVAALKNASNMKGVKADEHVTVTVFGAPAAIGGEARTRKTSTQTSVSRFGAGQADRDRALADRERVLADRERAASGIQIENARTSLQGTVLTLRIKKSEIDAAGKDDADALAKKAQVSTYAGNGHGLSSVNSWIKSSSSSGMAR